MATTARGGPQRQMATVALALLATLAIAAPTLATPGGNAVAAAACQDGGYVDWTDAAGNAFRNSGACVSYAARGGTLVPVVVEPPEPVNPFSVVYRTSGINGFQGTVSATGLEPDSSVDVVLTWGATPITVGDVADSTGTAMTIVSGICSMGGSPITAVTAMGTPAGGEHTEYPLPTPDSTVCP